MKIKAIRQSIILHFFLIVVFVSMTAPMAMSEMILNDNVNIEGELFLNGEGSGITFSDGTSQVTATPSWHQILPANERFELVMGDEAVLDRETGLVWQRNTDDNPYDWYNAQIICYYIDIGGRGGWRLPSIEELRTLVDRTQSSRLPDGHPFLNAKSDKYWSSTIVPDSITEAFYVYFSDGMTLLDRAKTKNHYVRAVRSGQ